MSLPIWRDKLSWRKEKKKVIIKIATSKFFFFNNMSNQSFAPTNPMGMCRSPVPYALGNYQAKWP